MKIFTVECDSDISPKFSAFSRFIFAQIAIESWIEECGLSCDRVEIVEHDLDDYNTLINPVICSVWTRLNGWEHLNGYG